MKKWVLSLSLAVGMAGLVGCSGQSEDLVASTKAGNVTKEELYDAMKERIGEQTLQQLVLEKVLSKEYKVTDKEIDEKLEELKDQLGPQFQMALLQSGYTDEEDFREALKLNLLQEKAATKDIKVTEEEVKEYYEQKKPDIEVRHILFDPEDEEKAKEIKEKLDAGEDFSALAKEHSKDPGTAEQGGELGFISEDDPNLDEQFKEAAFKLEKDEISAPVESAFGWHIIQVTDKEEKPPFDQVKEQYENELKISKIDPTVMQKVIKEELEKAKISVKDKELKETFDSILNAPEEDANDDEDDVQEEKDESQDKEAETEQEEK